MVGYGDAASEIVSVLNDLSSKSYALTLGYTDSGGDERYRDAHTRLESAVASLASAEMSGLDAADLPAITDAAATLSAALDKISNSSDAFAHYSAIVAATTNLVSALLAGDHSSIIAAVRTVKIPWPFGPA
jgi:hypothetical protein